MGHFESRLETVETNAAWLKQRSRWAVAAFFVLELALAAYQQQMMPAQQPAQSLTVQP